MLAQALRNGCQQIFGVQQASSKAVPVILTIALSPSPAQHVPLPLLLDPSQPVDSANDTCRSYALQFTHAIHPQLRKAMESPTMLCASPGGPRIDSLRDVRPLDFLYLCPVTTPSITDVTHTRTKLFVRGLQGTTEAQLVAAFSRYGEVRGVEVKPRFAFVDMSSPRDAEQALAAHGTELIPGTGKLLEALRGTKRSRTEHSEGDGDRGESKETVSYTRDGLRVGEEFYPFPSNKYLLQLIHLMATQGASPLTALLARQRPKLDKEISESFGVVAALKKAVQLVDRELFSQRVVVYVPGDGRKPYTSAAICLSTPAHWTVVCIDPALRFDTATLGAHADRITCSATRSEEFDIAAHEASLDGGKGRVAARILVAVHSHADLPEFFGRLSSRGHRVCVSLPCCGSCGLLPMQPLLVADDPDILSPRRTLYTYHHAAEHEESHTDTKMSAVE